MTNPPIELTDAPLTIDGVRAGPTAAPADRRELAELLRWAAAEGLAVIPRGGGSRLALGNPPERGGLALDLRQLNRVLDFQPADMTVTVEAGITLEALQQAVAAAGQFVPLEGPGVGYAPLRSAAPPGNPGDRLPNRNDTRPPYLPGETRPIRNTFGLPELSISGGNSSPRRHAGGDDAGSRAAPGIGPATVGGTLAVASVGPLAAAYGPPRDWLLGLSVVSAAGVETKAGGKVVKNVTGYDLNKLYTGSLGTLGVIVEATFKIAPRPPEFAALLGGFATLPEAAAAGARLLDLPAAPLGYAAMSAGAWRRVSGGGVPPDDDEAVGLAFYGGRAAALRRRTGDGRRLLAVLGGRDLRPAGGADAETWRQQLTNLGWETDTPPALAIRIAAPRRAVAELAGECQRLAARRAFPGGSVAEVVADPGYGVVRLLWWNETGLTDTLNAFVLELIAAVRQAAAQYGGAAVVERCPAAAKQSIDVWGDFPGDAAGGVSGGIAWGGRAGGGGRSSAAGGRADSGGNGEPAALAVMRRLKEQFDPQRILNPGRFIGRI